MTVPSTSDNIDAVQVDDSPPQMEQDGQVYNAPDCKLALTQSQTDMMW